jgi:phage shock protein A
VGLVKRLRRITAARVDAFLRSASNPEAAAAALVAEMEDGVRLAANAEAKALTAVNAAQRKLDESQGRTSRLGRGAELALRKGDEATAREVLAEQVKTERAAGVHQQELARAEAALRDAREVRRHLADEQGDLQVRHRELISRARTAALRKRALDAGLRRGESILEQVAAMERGLDEAEARVEPRGAQTGGASLEARLRDLHREASVEERLRRLARKDGDTAAGSDRPYERHD